VELQVKINHLVYKVLPLPPLMADAESALGMHINRDLAIYIRTDQPPAEQVRILWHELIHVFYHSYNLPREERDEESVCMTLESPLAGLFRDNPKLPAVFAAAFAGKPIVR
jgi:hypothetical protein